VVAGDSLALLDLVERLSEYGADYRNFARELLLHFRELLVVKVAPADSALLTPVVPEERERLKPLADALAEDDILRMIDVLTKAETDLRWAQDPRVTLELALLKLVQMRRLLPFQELVDRVERMAAGVPAQPAPSPGREAVRVAVPAPAPMSAPRTVAVAPAPAGAAPPSPPSPSPPPVAAAAAIVPAALAVSASPAPASGDSVLAAMVLAAQNRPSLLQPLRGATARLEGDTLVLGVAPDWNAFAAMHQDEYRELASKAAGRSVKLRLDAAVAAPQAKDETAPSPTDVRRDRLMKEAQKEPAVQEALDLFDGRLVDVREAKPGQ
jgi:DNA polymerase III gamma/tau subunit